MSPSCPFPLEEEEGQRHTVSKKRNGDTAMMTNRSPWLPPCPGAQRECGQQAGCTERLPRASGPSALAWGDWQGPLARWPECSEEIRNVDI